MVDINAKQYLRQIKILEGRVQRNKARLETLRASLSGLKGIVYDADKVQTSPEDRLLERMTEIIDLERQTVSEIIRLEKLKTEITEKIHTLGDANEEEILYLRWVERLDFYEIAEQVGYSLRQVHNIHGRALKDLEERLHTFAHDNEYN